MSAALAPLIVDDKISRLTVHLKRASEGFRYRADVSVLDNMKLQGTPVYLREPCARSEVSYSVGSAVYRLVTLTIIAQIDQPK